MCVLIYEGLFSKYDVRAMAVPLQPRFFGMALNTFWKSVLHMHLYTHVFMHICKHMHIHMHVCMHTWSHVCTYACTHIEACIQI